MVYSAPHLYLTVGGDLVGGEMWQFGTRWSGDETTQSIDSAFAQIGLDDIRDDVATWYGFAQNMFPDDCNFHWVKLALIEPDGSYRTDPRISELTTPQAGGSNGAGATSYAPVQTSLCVSLRSGQTLGQANRGRVYLPPIVHGRAPGQPGVSEAVATAVLTGFRTMMEAVAGEMYTVGYGARLRIMSTLGAGTTRGVLQLMLGNIIDTQRRRRNQYEETYVSQDWTV